MKIWLWATTGVALLVVTAVTWPFMANARRPRKVAFKIDTVYTRNANVRAAFDVSGMTRSRAVAEGDCDGGCTGGVLAQHPPDDVKELVPDLTGYDGARTTVIWVYQVKPMQVTRHNDVFGDDTVTISGIGTKDQKVYFAVVPKQIVELPLYWLYAEPQRG